MKRHPSLPWILPFLLFLILLALLPQVGMGPRVDGIIRLTLVGGVLVFYSRRVVDLRIRHWVSSGLLGVVVFLVWIGPDLLFAGWRDLPIFRNPLTVDAGGFPAEGVSDPVAVTLRIIRAAVLVPIIEEMFWRGWLPRWIINPDFEKVPLGTYTALAFGVTAVLFASEHGAWWDVGLAAGVAYNWWMLRTRSLGDCILAHAVTNACLAGYVIATGRWEYW